MYTIYVNDRPLRLLNEPTVAPASAPPTRKGTRLDMPTDTRPDTHLVAHYSGKPRTLLNYVDMLEKGSPRVLSVDLVYPDLPRLWQDFRGHYKWVAAAGGIVQTEANDEILCIYRRDSWDLPKGKLDEGEDAQAAALREVMEETGLTELTLGEALPTTYHTYRNRKDKRVLKPTYWFSMTAPRRELVPQKEEDIEVAAWQAKKWIARHQHLFYASLAALLNAILADDRVR